MYRLFILTLIAATGLLFSNCGNKTESSEGDHGHEHGGHEEESTTTVSLTAEQIKSIKVGIGTIEKKQLTATLKANGLLKVPNQNKAVVTSLLGGVVQSILIQPGNKVKKGQVLATVTNMAFITMQEEYLSISSQATLAESEFQRQRELKEGNAGALKNYQTAEAELKHLKIRQASLQKQLELVGVSTASLSSGNIQSTISIKSPINGTVSNVWANIGSFADANTPVVEIVDNSQLHLDLTVYEKDLPKLQVGQTIHFTLTNNPGKEYDAIIYGISNSFEEGSNAVAVHAEVKGDKTGLIDGMSIIASVSLESSTMDAVPTDAIVSYEGQDYIFIVTDKVAEDAHGEHGHDENEAGHKHEEGEATHKHEEGEASHDHSEETAHAEENITFERIPVRKGTTDVGYSEITLLKDIPANSKVVVSGAFFVLAKMTNQGEGHAH